LFIKFLSFNNRSKSSLCNFLIKLKFFFFKLILSLTILSLNAIWNIEKFLTSIQDFLKLLQTITIFDFIHNPTLQLRYSLTQLFKEILDNLGKLLFNQFRINLIKFRDTLFILIKCVLKLRIQFFTYQSDELYLF